MINGIIGKKLGMTQIFDKEGNIIPATVIEAGPCTVLELKESPKLRIKIGYAPMKEPRSNKPQLGFFKKINVTPLRHIKEFNSSDNKDYTVGQVLKADIFKAGDFVDVTGTSIGKGFAGGMKRWHWMGGPATHGSMHHRRVGSVGANTDPGRIFKGKTMPGHLGAHRTTIQGLRVMKVDADNNLLVIKGAIPGSKNSIIVLKRSFKKAFRSLDEQKAVVVHKKNPMKQSKAKAAGKGK